MLGRNHITLSYYIIPASTQNMNDGIKTGSKAGGNGNFEGGQALWAKLGAKLGATLGATVTLRSGNSFVILLQPGKNPKC